MTAENASAVPTLSAGAKPRNKIRIGAVIEPAPTPVRPTIVATANPRSISLTAFPHDRFRSALSTATKAHQRSAAQPKGRVPTSHPLHLASCSWPSARIFFRVSPGIDYIKLPCLRRTEDGDLELLPPRNGFGVTPSKTMRCSPRRPG